MNRANLEKLAAYLEQLPEDYTHFDMGLFLTLNDVAINAWTTIRAGACGTVACALGHGPAAGIILATKNADWDAYGEKAFELVFDEWDWCFSSGWASVDNTPHGAAKRIRHLLDHGVPSNGWEQRCRYKPYMFANSDAQEPDTA
jgi:hypothetical protein